MSAFLVTRAECQRAPLTAADLPSQLSPASRQLITRLGDSLRSARLPDEPLYAKAAEGVLKGADEARIVSAVRALARRLGEARAALGSGVEDADIVAAASALHEGATPAMLVQLRDTQRAAGSSTSLATPLVALVDLLARHVPPGTAATAIETLVARRAPIDDFAALRAGVARDIYAGEAPEAAVTQRMKNIEVRGRP
jgi:hypothetical protein